MLTLSYDLSHELVSFESSSHLYVLVRIKAPAVEMKKRRLLNLGLVLDRSGSMEGAKLDHVRHASRFLVSQLSSEDILSIVTFHTNVEVLSPAEPVKNKEELKRTDKRHKVCRFNQPLRGMAGRLSGGIEKYFKGAPEQDRHSD